MPYADNLYSADDSDGESFSDELSPTDGYFTGHDRPQDLMVLDPSLQEETAESKAQEARQEADANSRTLPAQPVPSSFLSTAPYSYDFQPVASAANPPSSAPSSTSGSLTNSFRRDELYTEHSSLLNSAPPPAYSAAASQGSAFQSEHPNRNYQTISIYDVEGGRLSHREPESMGQAIDFDSPQPAWRPTARILWTRSFVRNMLLVLLMVGMGVGFLVTGIKSGQSHHKEVEDPSRDHPGPLKPVEPGNPVKPPNMPKQPSDGHVSYCPSATEDLSGYMPTYEISQGKQLAVLQIDYDYGDSQEEYLRTAGKVIFRRLPESKRDSKTGFITFSVWGSSRHGVGPEVNIDEEVQAVLIKLPRHSTLGGKENCLSVEVTAWLPEDSVFETVQCFASQLSIEVFDGINVHASGKVVFESTAGDIIMPSVNESNPAIRKALPQLRDLRKVLEHATEDEAVPVNEISGKKLPLPAISAASGSLHRSHELPPSRSQSPSISDSRNTQRGIFAKEMSMQTSSGSITGTFLLCDNLELYSQSGNIDVVILPQKSESGSPIAMFGGESQSGSLRVRYPIYGDYEIPERDYRTHLKSRSGSISGTYFLGTEFEANTNSGSVKIEVLSGTSQGKSSLSTTTFSGSTYASLFPRRRSVPDKSDFIDIGDGDPYLLYPPAPNQAGALSQDRSFIRELTSKHMSNSGSIKLRYPEEWEGEIHASTIAGSIRVSGPDVRTIKEGNKNWAFKEVIARKGTDAEHASLADVNAIVGEVDVWIGSGYESGL
ncbi:MAG: hypothetical protein M1818_001872 [Claussenomyces sp. TS43310]|nr:MAG: hypothetical protein M1818_001872 [Claussenomyces sp. TS43310]